MHSDKDKSDQTKDVRPAQSPNEVGCLVLKIKAGEELKLGETTLYFKEVNNLYARVAIKATKDIKIKKTP